MARAEHIQEFSILSKKPARKAVKQIVARSNGRRKAPPGYTRQDGKPTREQRSKAHKTMFQMMREAIARIEADRPVAAKMRQHTEEDLQNVLRAVANGDTLSAYCREHGLHPGDVSMALRSGEEHQVAYAQARESQAHMLVERNIDAVKALQFIDTSEDGANVAVQIAKHAFDVYRWTAGKYHVGAYGDRVTQVHEGGSKPVRMITSEMTDEEAMGAFSEMVKKATT